jgi:hypothetical protein
VAETARRHAVALRREEVATLSQTREPSLWGCIGFAVSLLVRLPLELLRRFFRTVLFFLAVRDATSAATRLFHESVLLELGLEAWPGAPAAAMPNREDTGARPAERLREAIDRTWSEVDPRPIRQTVRTTLRGGWSRLRDAARTLARKVRGASRKSELGIETESALPGPLLDRLAVALSHEGAYLSDLKARFLRHWPGPPEPATATREDPSH